MRLPLVVAMFVQGEKEERKKGRENMSIRPCICFHRIYSFIKGQRRVSSTYPAINNFSFSMALSFFLRYNMTIYLRITHSFFKGN